MSHLTAENSKEGPHAAQEAPNGRYWLDIGSGAWDTSGRPSEVRLDRALVVSPSAIRREGATVPRDTWEMMLQALKKPP